MISMWCWLTRKTCRSRWRFSENGDVIGDVWQRAVGRILVEINKIFRRKNQYVVCLIQSDGLWLVEALLGTLLEPGRWMKLDLSASPNLFSYLPSSPLTLPSYPVLTTGSHRVIVSIWAHLCVARSDVGFGKIKQWEVEKGDYTWGKMKQKHSWEYLWTT